MQLPMSSSSEQRGFVDAAARAQSTLDFILADKETKLKQRAATQVPVTQALHATPVVHFSSDRTASRVLFITSNPEAMKEGAALFNHLSEIAVAFAEVHVAVLQFAKKKPVPTKRIGQKMWLYSVIFSSRWWFNQTLESFAETQLQFSDGFRPDVIVALDPYDAGQAALWLSKRYQRPHQVHVLEDFTTESFAAAHKTNKQKVKLARATLKRAKSVRTNSSVLKKKLTTQFPKIEDMGMLPRHFDTDSLVKAKRSNVLKEKYPQYVFIMLAAGILDHDSTIFRVIDAARSLLSSPRIGLVVVGDGPMRNELIERATILGIKEQVVFEKNTSVLPEYLLSADMYICADTSTIGDEFVIQAAAAGLPIVMSRTPLREDLFVDGESALLCEPENTLQFNQKMNSILNTNAYRLQFGTNARQIVKDRLHTDPAQYIRAYRDSIEVVFGKIDLPEQALVGSELMSRSEAAATAVTTESSSVPKPA